MPTKKIQSFSAKCIRQILYPGKKEGHNGISNKEIRQKWAIPTVSSKIKYNEACNIHRWRNTLSPVYLNNKTRCSNAMNEIQQEWDKKREKLRSNEIDEETEFFLKTLRKE